MATLALIFSPALLPATSPDGGIGGLGVHGHPTGAPEAPVALPVVRGIAPAPESSVDRDPEVRPRGPARSASLDVPPQGGASSSPLGGHLPPLPPFSTTLPPPLLPTG